MHGARIAQFEDNPMIRSFEGRAPQIGPDVFVADSALVLGEVRIGAQSSVWYHTVVRGDVHSISIGARTNLQDHCVVHVTTDLHATAIGDDVTVGHGAIVHGCRVGDRTLIGIGAILMDGVEVGEGCVVAAGSLLPPGKIFPARSLIVGYPAQVKRPVTEDEARWILGSAETYVALARRHAASHA
jgi:carbonic anhydrase/acetyltransferase-like protein (isoleucine patch superfamily)